MRICVLTTSYPRDARDDAGVFGGRPYIITLRGEDVRLLRISALRLLFRPVLTAAYRIVSVNDAFVAELRDRHGISAERLAAIPNGIAYEPPAPETTASVRAR